MVRISLLFVFVFNFYFSLAQQFSGFPPFTKWKQINTDTARIIFESPSSSQAQRIATLIHKMAAQQPNAIGNELQKINIVLHKNTTLANGYVALAPFRSEYYLIPSTNIFESGNLPWYEHLALHEYRHVQQYNNFNNGLTKVFNFFLGEEGRAVANGLTVPQWFFEGDAVHTETSLTPQGRGRLPLFYSGFTSLWEEGKNYSLLKLLNGSLKDYVPNHYQLGYLVTNYGYKKYGDDFWKNVTKDATSFKGLFYPFNKAIKRYSGEPYKKFMRQALNDYKKEISFVASKSKKDEVVTNYYFPQAIGNDSLIYLKDSYKKIPAFYIRDKNGEHKIKQKNISSEEWFSYRNGIIAYTAYSPNARWSLSDYSDIILLDTKTGEEKKFTKKAKYFTPDISPSGNSLVAVTFNDSLQTELHFMNAKDGSIDHKIKSRENYFLHPRFIDEENIVILKRRDDGTISLNRMNILSGETERLITPSFTVIGYPSVQDNTIYFTAAYEGNDDIYAYRLKDKKTFKLTSEQTGNYYANASAGNIVWSKFTTKGLQLQRNTLSKMQWQEIMPPQKQKIIFPVADTTANILATPTETFEISNYKKSTRLFNFHSWRPYYDASEYTFTLYGDNVLSTFSTEVVYRYNENERSHGLGFDVSYGGLFPVLTAGAEYTLNRHVNIRTNQTTKPGLLNAYELRGGYYIPLDFSGDKTYKNLTFGSNYVFSQQMPVGNTKDILSTFGSSYLHHWLNWSQRLPRAVQNIFPKFGYAINNSYRHRLDENGYQAITKEELYLPSFGNHSIVLSGSFQQVDTSNILFSNKFSLSRGYPDYYYSRMWRTSANYHLPLAYPDWGFGGIVYFLRVRSNLFYDFSRVYSKTKLSSADLRSVGTEVFFDTKWWNQLPVTFGIRYSYLLDADRFGLNKHQWEFVIPTNLIQ
jgi:hypothetical protein